MGISSSIPSTSLARRTMSGATKMVALDSGTRALAGLVVAFLAAAGLARRLRGMPLR